MSMKNISLQLFQVCANQEYPLHRFLVLEDHTQEFVFIVFK